MLSEPLRVVVEIAAVFERLQVSYLVGGSLASSMYGVPRSTQDVDLVARLLPRHVGLFVQGLAPSFHIDDEMVHRAVTERGPFNIIHRDTLYKADIFVPEDDEWIDVELGRAREETLELEGRSQSVRFATPEDVLLHKLVWYRMGGEVSDRQLADIRGLFQVQGSDLEFEYLKKWARALGVEDLLLRIEGDRL